MAQTFDIRFAKSAGFAAMLEVPANGFRWKGGGRLSIDSQGFSIGVKRSLLALLRPKRTQRIPTEDLRAVYREGDALRVEFQAGKTERVVLPFWADNREAAEQIVRLLPTSQTVEIEHSTAQSRKPRADWRMLLIIGVATAAFVGGSWTLYQRSEPPLATRSNPVSDLPSTFELPVSVPMPDATASLDDSPALAAEASPADPGSADPDSAPLPRFLEPPPFELRPPAPLPLPGDYVRSEDFVIPIPRGTVHYNVAKREIAAFEQEATQLESGFRAQHDLGWAGVITLEDLASRLGEYEMRWWDLTFRIFDNDALADPALLDVRAAMLATARLWRGFLSGYATGLRERDNARIAHAHDYRARAQEMQSRLRLFLR